MRAETKKDKYEYKDKDRVDIKDAKTKAKEKKKKSTSFGHFDKFLTHFEYILQKRVGQNVFS
jgi:hypothetical protein